jgi:hypothetical protein
MIDILGGPDVRKGHPRKSIPEKQILQNDIRVFELHFTAMASENGF